MFTEDELVAFETSLNFLILEQERISKMIKTSEGKKKLLKIDIKNNTKLLEKVRKL
jgi:hypothetical protein